VIDASVAAMWVLSEPYSASALALAADCLRAKRPMLAPLFMPTEVTSAVYKRIRRGEMTLEQAQEALDVVAGFGVQLEDVPAAHPRAIALAHELNRPTPHDSYYLVLAEVRAAECWTGDERLYNAARARCPLLRWIGTYTQAP